MSLSFWQVTEGYPRGKQRRERGSFTEVVEKVRGSISFSQASTSPFHYAAEDSESTLAGLTREKCVSINIKEPGLLFTLASPRCHTVVGFHFLSQGDWINGQLFAHDKSSSIVRPKGRRYARRRFFASDGSRRSDCFPFLSRQYSLCFLNGNISRFNSLLSCGFM